MPNWCNNRVSFYSDNEQDITKLRSIFESDEPFNAIVPSPDWKTTPNEKPGATYGELPRVREMKRPDGTVFHACDEFSDGTQDDRWYHWQIEHWGTKWEIANVECDGDAYSFTCEFETAWSPAEGIFYALREQYPDVDCTWFYDEPGMQFAGYLGND
tara:strand:+ start:57 stop:527 length:471 start_codon:yes stop_codon:yes gene_type:complete